MVAVVGVAEGMVAVGLEAAGRAAAVRVAVAREGVGWVVAVRAVAGSAEAATVVEGTEVVVKAAAREEVEMAAAG